MTDCCAKTYHPEKYCDTGSEDAGFQARTEARQLIGPFNPALLTPALSSVFVEFQIA